MMRETPQTTAPSRPNSSCPKIWRHDVMCRKATWKLGMGKGSKDGGGVGSIGIWGEDDHQNGSIMIKELKFEIIMMGLRFYLEDRESGGGF